MMEQKQKYSKKDYALLKIICSLLTKRINRLSSIKFKYSMSDNKSLTSKFISKSDIVLILKDILNNSGVEVPAMNLSPVVNAAYTKFNRRPKESLYRLALDKLKQQDRSDNKKEDLQKEYIDKLRKNDNIPYDEDSWLAGM